MPKSHRREEGEDGKGGRDEPEASAQQYLASRREAFTRRGLLLAGGLAAGLGPIACSAASTAERQSPQRILSARDFGAVGDGSHDDTAPLQSALNATFASDRPGVLTIPPGLYKISRTLQVRLDHNVVNHGGIDARGAHIQSTIENGANVFEVLGRGVDRFITIDGLDIRGSKKDGHGIYLEADSNRWSLYNCCLRDVVVQNAGGDGCRLFGNVFESQIINSYFRDNRGNGITFSHGRHGGILSSIHVFGCVFGKNSEHGAVLTNGCTDVGFHGCYFLDNRHFGLVASNGLTAPLVNCGFENNHRSARAFEEGDAGLLLRNFGTLIGCMGYSQFSQTRLVQAALAGRLVMVGCRGTGDKRAAKAGLARIGGSGTASATLVGCTGRVEYERGFEGLELNGDEDGINFGSDWNSRYLPRLGEYRLWVDRQGRLRMKRGRPGSDNDGHPVGA
jgi:hypothetical protein